jgi:hypothetical protein
MSDWWRAVEGALERLSDEGPDPWADARLPADGAELTSEQRAFLAQLAETPVHMADESDFLDAPLSDPEPPNEPELNDPEPNDPEPNDRAP